MTETYLRDDSTIQKPWRFPIPRLNTVTEYSVYCSHWNGEEMMSMATQDRVNDETQSPSSLQATSGIQGFCLFEILSYTCIYKIHCYLFWAETTHDLLWRLCRPGYTVWHKGMIRGKIAMGNVRHSYYYHLIHNKAPFMRAHISRIFRIHIFIFCFNQKAQGAMPFPVPLLAILSAIERDVALTAPVL